MRTPIQARLTLNNLLMLLIAMGFAGGLAWVVVEKLYLDTQRENLLAQAGLIAAALHGTPIQTESPQPYLQTANVLPGIHTRLLSEGGAVLVGLPFSAPGSFVPLPQAEGSAAIAPEELVRRPEIQTALAGDAATAIRRVSSAGNRRVLYAAAPIYSINGKIAGIVYLATPLPIAGLPGSMALQLLGAVLLAVFLAILAGRGLALQITRPLQDLARSADVLAGGDLEHHPSLQSDITELHQLGRSFTSMAENLREADQAQKRFIADVTHELRTPLTVIKGTIETLEDGALDDIRGRIPLLDSMHRETDRLIRLVNELLVLVRADAGELRLQRQPLALGKLARARCEVLSLLAAHQQVELHVMDETRKDACLHGDSDRLSQALDNLLDNAIRHAPPGSRVTIRIREEAGGFECAVSDQGAGIPSQHLPHIFDRFYRIDDARDRSRGGLGLGLAIARAIVHAHGGHIAAESNAVAGTTLTFWLPAASSASESPVS